MHVSSLIENRAAVKSSSSSDNKKLACASSHSSPMHHITEKSPSLDQSTADFHDYASCEWLVDAVTVWNCSKPSVGEIGEEDKKRRAAEKSAVKGMNHGRARAAEEMPGQSESAGMRRRPPSRHNGQPLPFQDGLKVKYHSPSPPPSHIPLTSLLPPLDLQSPPIVGLPLNYSFDKIRASIRVQTNTISSMELRNFSLCTWEASQAITTRFFFCLF